MAKKVTFIRIDFIRCVSPEYGYTIIRDIAEARDFLEHELDMDDNSSVKIYPVKMTEKQFGKLVEQWERNA